MSFTPIRTTSKLFDPGEPLGEPSRNVLVRSNHHIFLDFWEYDRNVVARGLPEPATFKSGL